MQPIGRLRPWLSKVDRTTIAVVGGVVAFGYFVLVGEAGQHDPNLFLMAANALAAGVVIAWYVLDAPRQADRLDSAVVVALLFFAAAAVLANFPRQALDALLGALLYAAAFYLARSLLAFERTRSLFVPSLTVLSAVLVFLTAARWLLPVAEWWSLTGWTVVPPLTLELSGDPWGHRHDLTLLIVMLYPAWWLGRVSPLRAALATVVGLLTVLIVLVDGSRTLWLAIGIASAVVGLLVGHKRWPTDVRRRIGIGAVVAVAILALSASGLLGLVAERAFSSASVDLRWAMWRPLTDAWLAKPVSGFGPGSFPWVLQLTDYFQTNSLAPRHPDSAVFQLLVEAGILGVTTVVVLVITLTPVLLRGRSRAALWALGVFLVAGLGAQPTDFGFLVAVAIVWAAYAVPRVLTPAGRETPWPALAAAGRRKWIRAATIAAFAAVAIGWTATSLSSLAYAAARTEIEEGHFDEATRSLRFAITFDPGMALYPRQLGAVHLLQDMDVESIANLEKATELNPSDDLAWRELALAFEVAGDPSAAERAVDHALEVQRSDPTNLLLAARLKGQMGVIDEAVATLAEVIQAWPMVVAAPGWTDLLPPNTTTHELVEVALDRWLDGRPSPEPRALQPIMLAVMAGRVELAQEWAVGRLGPSLGTTYVSVMTCSDDAAELLEEAPETDRRTSIYWSLVARQAALDGSANQRASRLVEIMSGLPFPGQLDEYVSPLNENGGRYSADVWGYRRVPVEWPTYEPLPSIEVGAARWLVEPRSSTHAAGLAETLPSCA